MSNASQDGRRGLNDEVQKGNIRTIEKRVKKFRAWLTRPNDYPHNPDAQKMIEQIDTYWEKLFADPITVQTPSGPIRIQPQRTNNILEQFFRNLKRANRRRTGKASLEEVFAEIEIDTLRQAFREAQLTPEKIPSKLKPLIAMPDFPEKLLNMVEKAAA